MAFEDVQHRHRYPTMHLQPTGCFSDATAEWTTHSNKGFGKALNEPQTPNSGVVRDPDPRSKSSMPYNDLGHTPQLPVQ